MLIELPDDEQYWSETIHLPDVQAKRSNVLKALINHPSLEEIERKMALEKEINKLTSQLEMLTGNKVVLVQEGAIKDDKGVTVHENVVDEDFVIDDTMPHNSDEVCEVCKGEMFDENGAECMHCPDMAEALNERGDDHAGPDGEPIQVYFPKGFRKKLRDRAKKAGKFTISDYVRDKVM